tara:strand:- start:95 stop:937 length:843 start_codon:yes stop_codon:yes gene_type:complete
MAAPEQLEVAGLNWRVFGIGGGDTGSGRGTGTPLVVLHGLFGAGDNWRSQAQELASGRPVLVPDMPNHGTSAHTEDMDYAAVAARIWEALDAMPQMIGLSGESYAILGHSMGGKAAMAMAFARPEATERLIVADIAPRRYPPRHEEIFAAMEAVAAAGVARRGEADRVMEPYIPEKPVRLFLLKSLVPAGDGDGYRWQLNLEGLRRSYDAISDWPFTDERYGGPALFVTGGASPYVSERDHPAISAHFPEARIETIPGVGHWLHAEARDSFVEIVRDFLS